MKKILFAFVALSLLAIGCKEKIKQEPPVDPAITLSVTEIENNGATVKAESEGDVVSGKIVTHELTKALTFDLENEIQLIKFVENNGEAITFPYETKIARLRSGQEFVTIVIGYNAEGRASLSEYVVWESVGGELSWSEENSAGNLEDNKW